MSIVKFEVNFAGGWHWKLFLKFPKVKPYQQRGCPINNNNYIKSDNTKIKMCIFVLNILVALIMLFDRKYAGESGIHRIKLKIL